MGIAGIMELYVNLYPPDDDCCAPDPDTTRTLSLRAARTKASARVEILKRSSGTRRDGMKIYERYLQS